MSSLINFLTRNLLKPQSFRLLSKTPVQQTLRESLRGRVLSTQTALIRKAFSRSFCSPVNHNLSGVVKDVILFKYENPKFYKILNFFGIGQFIFWTYLSHFAFTTLKDAPVEINEETPWYQKINLGDNKYRNGITIFCFLMGYGILASVWLFTLRSVRFLILRKGGKDLTFVTYGPFNRNRLMTVPLKNVSAQEARELAKVQLPLKVKNRSLFYVLDMRGEFRNERLFDTTAGLKRNFQH